MAAWTEKEIKYVLKRHEKGDSRHTIADKYKEEFGTKRTANSIKHCIDTYEDYDVSEEAHIASLKQLHSTRKSKSKVAKDNKAIMDNMIIQEEFLAEFKESLKTSTFKIHPIVKKVPKKPSNRTIVAHISDTHFGADIDSEEMGGLNGYTNVEEARRLAFFVKEVASYKIDHRKDTDLVIALNADIIQGMIHNIDTTTPLTSQFSRALHLLSQGISYLANEYSSVKVICTTGNHGRAMHRPDKGRPTKNRWDGYSTMLNIALEYALKPFKNVSFDIPTTPYWYGKIRGHNYFIVHSDAVLSTGSIGKNVSVDSIKNKVNDLISGIGSIDVVLAGHTHIPLATILNNGTTLLCNGNLSGVDEFCLSIGIVTNHPSQQLFEVTDKYCVGDLRNVMVLEADKDKSLDKIIAPFTKKF
jgi:hypothetical protein